LDEGTTSARAALYDETGSLLAMESRPAPCGYPQPGWVEQDGEAIWRAQCEAARAALALASGRRVAVMGITNQRETALVWDRRSGRPVAPAIVWQCRRTAAACEALHAAGRAAEITRRTGLMVDPYFSATKIRWILEHTPGAEERARGGDLLFGTVDTWLVWKLTGGRQHVTDVSNASRTMLMNLETGDWDPYLLDIFDIPRAMLPRIVSSAEYVGDTDPGIFGAALPIAALAGDQQAALAGQACFRPGLSKNTYGTGCFALLHTGANPPTSRHGLVATRAASFPREAAYAIEGSTFVAGAAVQWLRDQLGVLRTAAESEELAQSLPDNGGVYLVPAFAGLGAPHWDAQARGLLTGLTAATSKAHLARAALESIAYQTCELIQAMEADAGEPLTELRVDGGAAVNNFLMQFQADMLGKPIVRPADVETTARGAAYLAGLAAGVWRGIEEIESFWRPERRFEPNMDPSVRRRNWEGWQAAVSRCRKDGQPGPD
jgi:glycerol kinase